ncbi:MAG TPA: tetratricopeptide repeat protein [Noviherbaspirillum sp.]
MSLINQMLKELDARRADTIGSPQYGQQVRAVARRNTIHPAWWVALALATIIAGVLTWLVLRPLPVVRNALTQLPLKPQIVSNPTPVSSPLRKTAEAAPMPPAMTPAGRQSGFTHPAPTAKHDETQEKSVPSVKPAPVRIARETPAIPAPPVSKVGPTEIPVVKAPDTAASVSINKQVKELSAQQRAENAYRQAISVLQQGKAAEAISGLEQALRLDPKHVAARQTLIGILLDSKRSEEALRHAQEGYRLDPAQVGMAMILARLQLEKGELRGAIETLEHTLPYAADHADYQAFLAGLLQRNDQHKEATEHYLLALQKAPQNGVWWMGMGISLCAEHRIAEAQEAFKRAKASNTLSVELLAFVEAQLNQLQR